MRVIFSRKGFDSAVGKAPSPIIKGEPISLPIPTGPYPSETSYRDAGLGEIVEQVTKNSTRKVGADDFCHEDPVFLNGRWAFGQTGIAQAHLEKNCVGVGDLFLFFGLFALDGRDRHHRIFGYLKIDEVRRLGRRPSERDNPKGFRRRHPHTIGEKWDENNTLYLGSGGKARSAHPCLRLSKPGAPVSIWNIPAWLKAAGLTYHHNLDRWRINGELRVVSRGQEFVSDIGDQVLPRDWLRTVLAIIDGRSGDGSADCS